jgi:acyl-homoserine lactone acylase PvdQ
LKSEEARINAAIGRLSEKKQKRAKSALEILSKFDNVMHKDSQGAALIGAFYHVFTRNVFGDELEIDSGLWKGFIDINLRSYSAPQTIFWAAKRALISTTSRHPKKRPRPTCSRSRSPMHTSSAATKWVHLKMALGKAA